VRYYCRMFGRYYRGGGNETAAFQLIVDPIIPKRKTYYYFKIFILRVSTYICSIKPIARGQTQDATGRLCILIVVLYTKIQPI